MEVGPGPSPRLKKCLSFFFAHCDIGLVVETFLSSHGLRVQRRINREWASGTSCAERLEGTKTRSTLVDVCEAMFVDTSAIQAEVSAASEAVRRHD